MYGRPGPRPHLQYLPLFAVLAFIGLCLSSCFTGRVFTRQGPVAQTRPAAAPPASPLPAQFDAGPVVRQARADISKGRYETAIRAYRSALALHPGNPSLSVGYEMGLLETGRAAGAAFAKKKFARAGLLYTLVAEGHDCAPAKIAFLNRQVSSCARALNQEGLALYRQGRLKEAVACWRSILEFDPTDSEVKTAMKTAGLQIKNLSK